MENKIKYEIDSFVDSLSEGLRVILKQLILALHRDKPFQTEAELDSAIPLYVNVAIQIAQLRLSGQAALQIYNDANTAISKYSEAISIFPLSPDYYMRGTIFTSINRIDEAINDLNEAIRLKSDVPQYWHMRSVAYEIKGDTKAANENKAEETRLLVLKGVSKLMNEPHCNFNHPTELKNILNEKS